MSKSLIFFLVTVYLLSSIEIVLAQIIPPKKPLQSTEVTQKKLLIDTLKPLPKPKLIEKIKTDEKKVIVKKKKGFWNSSSKEKTTHHEDKKKRKNKNFKTL